MAGWSTWWAPRPEGHAERWQEFAALVACLLGLQLLDLMTTLGSLAHGAAEANPWAAGLLDRHGPAVLVQVKVVAVVLMLGWIPAFHLVQRERRRAHVLAFLGLLAALVVLYCGVVLNNLAVLAAQLAA